MVSKDRRLEDTADSRRNRDERYLHNIGRPDEVTAKKNEDSYRQGNDIIRNSRILKRPIGDEQGFSGGPGGDFQNHQQHQYQQREAYPSRDLGHGPPYSWTGNNSGRGDEFIASSRDGRRYNESFEGNRTLFICIA